MTDEKLDAFPYYGMDGKRITREQAMEMFTTSEQRRVAETTLPDGRWVSTVLLGIDHGWGEGPPIIFETMVFAGRSEHGLGDALDDYTRRYSTKEEAEQGHREVVDALLKGEQP